MANTLMSFCKSAQYLVGVTNPVIRKSGILFIKHLGIRTLYSPITLGLDNYIQQRERSKVQLSNVEARFKEKMSEYTLQDSKTMVFTEDLKNMLHLAEDEADVQLIIKMMKKFNQQNKQMRFGNFVFGPVVMRLFHHLSQPQVALQCFKDEDLDGMFDQLMTYQILLDLLFENKMYNEILETFELIKSKQIEGIKYAKNVIVLVFATCYKQNTPESLNYALKLWTELRKIGHIPMRRAITFCAAIAVNQGNPSAALEILSTTNNLNYTTIRNLRVAALLDIGRVEEAITVLKGVIKEDSASIGPLQTFDPDILNKVRVAVEKLGNSDVALEFNRLFSYFEKQGHISTLTLDEQLCQEIASPPIIGKRTNEYVSRSYPQQDRYRNNVTSDRMRFEDRTIGGKFTRPGLADL